MGLFDDIPLDNISAYVNHDIPAGISEFNVFFVPHDQVETDRALEGEISPAFDLKTAVVINENIILKEGKYFIKVPHLPNSGNFKDDLAGKAGNLKVGSTFEFFLSDTNPEHLAFMDVFKNVPGIWLVMDKSGRVRKFGSKISPAYLTTGSATLGGDESTDVGIQMTLKTNGRVAPIYKGEIPTIDSVNPSPSPAPVPEGRRGKGKDTP